MEHSYGFISTLVICLVCAFGGGLAARSIRLPPIVGYLFAGILIGPFVFGVGADQAIAAELAEVGVALLLFNIGLHFSLKDLIAVQGIALTGGLSQVLITTFFGSAAAYFLLGSGILASSMIGLSLAIASTAVSTRIIEEHHQMTSFAGRVALGWLVVQDIIVILALVLFPILAEAQNLSVETLFVVVGQTCLQVIGFVAVMLLGGRRLVPWLLGYVARSGSRELFTLSVIVVALGVAYGSSVIFGVSLALGAFFAGLLIGESDLNHHAASEALSMQQVFTVLFFVSVGMLFDPRIILQQPLEIFLLWLVVALSMGLVVLLLLMFLRVQPEGSGVVGGAFALIGEFSFVLSELGLRWGILTKDQRNVILAVALLGILVNPLIMKIYPLFSVWLSQTKFFARFLGDGERHMPSAEEKLAGHVILVGHGRVGSLVSDALKRHAVPCLTIEADRRLMERLRAQEEIVVFGDASREAVLKAAQPDTARLVVLALPDGSPSRRIVALIKRLYPELPIVVRVHSDTDLRHFNKVEVALSVMGEREVAFGLSAYALQLYGVESGVVLDTLSFLREQPFVKVPSS